MEDLLIKEDYVPIIDSNTVLTSEDEEILGYSTPFLAIEKLLSEFKTEELKRLARLNIGTIEEAPSNDNKYARKENQWVKVIEPDVTKAYVDELIKNLAVDEIKLNGHYLATLKQVDGKVLASLKPLVNNSDTILSYSDLGITSKVSLVKLTENLPKNVREAYEFRDKNNTIIGERINVYKDSTLKEAYLGVAEVEGVKQDCIILKYITFEGDELIVNIPLGDFLREKEFKDGLIINDKGEVRIKINEASSLKDKFLVVDQDGLKTEGITGAIETGDNKVSKALNDRIDKLEKDLNVIDSEETGKFITSVTQTNGKISITKAQVKAENVSIVDTENNFTGSDVESALNQLYKKSSDIDSDKTITINTDSTTKGYLKTYTINLGTKEIGKIDIPKDLVISSGEVVKGNWVNGKFTESESGNGTALKLVIANLENPIYINTLDLVKDHTPGNGINISDTNEISIHIDKNNESKFLSVSKDGLKLDGVQLAIDKAVADSYINEVTVNNGEEPSKDTEIWVDLNGRYFTYQNNPQAPVPEVNNDGKMYVRTHGNWIDVNEAIDARVSGINYPSFRITEDMHLIMSTNTVANRDLFYINDRGNLILKI